MNLLRLSLVLCVVAVFGLTKAVETYERCKRSDGLSGECVPITICPKLYKIYNDFTKNVTSADKNYLLKSTCLDVKSAVPDNYVCCEEKSEGMNILYGQKCGYIGKNPKTFSSHGLTLFSRPWMALLMLREDNVENFKCAGTLITQQFVLTAAHCFNNKELKFVRLGEFRISTAEDCGIVRGKYICAPPVEDVPFDRIIVHKDYSPVTGHNDIALVKLSRNVIVDVNGKPKRNIRSICLPLNDTLQQLPENMNTFHVTGWGETEHEGFSDVMLETNISRKSREDCHKALHRDILSSQICAGDLGFDCYSGDSGGPLLHLTDEYKNHQRFVQFGIVSFGEKCANGKPAVYTNVASFIHWIADNIVN